MSTESPVAAPDRSPGPRGPTRLWFASGVAILAVLLVLLRLAAVTDFLYHGLVKDPARTPPAGRVIVAPADGIVLYVRRVTDGVIPEVIKRGVPVPVTDHLKAEPRRPFGEGYLVGIYMNTQGVHINRVPNHGVLRRQTVYNGPHMNMTRAERGVILTQLVPGLTAARKALGLSPFAIESDADYVLHSARETLWFEDERGADLYLVRIADYYVGKILTWIPEGASVQRGEKLGMITWGSQTDLLFESSPGMRVTVKPGEYVYGGETILAAYP